MIIWRRGGDWSPKRRFGIGRRRAKIDSGSKRCHGREFSDRLSLPLTFRINRRWFRKGGLWYCLPPGILRREPIGSRVRP